MLSTSLLPTLKTGASSLSRLALHTASASSRLVRSPSSLFPSPPSSPFRSYSDSSEVDPLHYHPLPSPSRKLAISFLDLPPRSSRSATILGFLPADDPNATLADFVESKAFATTLHRAVKESLAEGEQRMESEAQGRGEGWIHVNDDRNYPQPGRIGDPSDLIGSVLVSEGKIQADTYTPMPAYRVLTPDGPTKLSDQMHQKLLSVLREIHAAEENEQVD